MALKPSTILNCIDKARKLQPLVEPRANRPGDYWVAGSTEAYLVEVRDNRVACTGSWKGECRGFAHNSCCYHSAAVALQLGLFTEAHEDALRKVAA